jgi:sulfotransferase family protein
MTLPNFLIIGSGRSGTTSLHNYLDAHPEVFMSRLKETDYFALEHREHLYGGPGVKWMINSSVSTRRQYEALFEGAAGYQAIGESSPRYLYTPEAIDNLKSTLPNAKLIVILRNPVERAFASYVGLRRDGWEKCKTFREAINDEQHRISENWLFGCYLSVGYYHRNLSRVYEKFPANQIRVYLYEDLRDDPEALFSDLLGFVGVSQKFSPNMSKRHNVSGIISNPILRTVWTGTAQLRTVMRPLLPHSLRHWGGRIFVRNLKKPELDPDLKIELIRQYRDDIMSLQDLIGRDLSAWLDM